MGRHPLGSQERFVKALSILKEKKRMTVQEFAKLLGYERTDVPHMIYMHIPRLVFGYLVTTQDCELVKCFRVVRVSWDAGYYVVWDCNDSKQS